MENVNKILDGIDLKKFDNSEETIDEKAERIEAARKLFFEKLEHIGIPPRFKNARLKDFEGVNFILITTKEIKYIEYCEIKKQLDNPNVNKDSFHLSETTTLIEHNEKYFKKIRSKINTDDLLRALSKGFSIKFIGESGRGKTHLAIALIVEMVKQKKSVSFLNDFEFRAISKKMFADKGYDPYVEYGRKRDIQLIDDLGSIVPDLATKPDSIMREIAMGIISERYNQMRQTIITSNFDLRKKLEVSSLSRLKQDFIEVEIIGDDKRVFK